jgi:hypothetical protein
MPQCAPPCRILAPDEPTADPRQCVVDADCGARAHADKMLCDHAGYCRPVCADHWGDCNEDYRDGCELQIKHRMYCDGDPRIHEYFPPGVTLHDEGQRAGPGRFDSRSFILELERHIAELKQCYRRAIATAPKLEGDLLYDFTLHETGRITSKLVHSEIESKDVEACVAQLVAAASFDQRPDGGSVTFAVRVELTAGYFNDE